MENRNRKQRKAENDQRNGLAAYAQIISAIALLIRSWMIR